MKLLLVTMYFPLAGGAGVHPRREPAERLAALLELVA